MSFVNAISSSPCERRFSADCKILSSITLSFFISSITLWIFNPVYLRSKASLNSLITESGPKIRSCSIVPRFTKSNIVLYVFLFKFLYARIKASLLTPMIWQFAIWTNSSSMPYFTLFEKWYNAVCRSLPLSIGCHSLGFSSFPNRADPVEIPFDIASKIKLTISAKRSISAVAIETFILVSFFISEINSPRVQCSNKIALNAGVAKLSSLP